MGVLRVFVVELHHVQELLGAGGEAQALEADRARFGARVRDEGADRPQRVVDGVGAHREPDHVSDRHAASASSRVVGRSRSLAIDFSVCLASMGPASR